jgi:Kef-type K+ transport system membrane component KefB
LRGFGVGEAVNERAREVGGAENRVQRDGRGRDRGGFSDLLTGWQEWLVVALIIGVASLGKFGGTGGAARLTGLPWREAAVLGTLMNTRGLMELVVLNIGLDLKIINPALFSMMVLMALVTTLATSPLVARLYPSRDFVAD